MVDDAAMSRKGTNIDPGSGARFDAFLVGTIGAVLVTRGYLAAAGYPQVGGSKLHVAHVLWGGLAMASAIVLGATRSSPRTRAWVALLGGVGFGLFLDEVGKFVTKDVNYFFQPAFAIMYFVLVLLTLVVRESVRRRRVSDTTRLVDASQAVTDLLRGELDEVTRASRLRRLDEVTEQRDVAEQLRALLSAGSAIPVRRFSPDNVARSARRRGDAFLLGVLSRRRLIRGLLIVGGVLAALTVLSSALVLLIDPGSMSGVTRGVALGSTTTSSALTLAGVLLLYRQHVGSGLRLLRAAVLVDLLISDLLTIETSQLGGLPDVVINLLLLAAIGTALRLRETVPEAFPTPPSPASASDTALAHT